MKKGYEDDEFPDYEEEQFPETKSAVQELFDHSQELLSSATQGWTEEQKNYLFQVQAALRGPNPPYRQVFVENDGKPYHKWKPCYSLNARDHEPGVLSLRRLFLDADDMTGAAFSLAAFDDLHTADLIFEAPWAVDHFNRWIKELAAFHEYTAMNDLQQQSAEGKTTATVKLLNLVAERVEKKLKGGRDRHRIGSAPVGRPGSATADPSSPDEAADLEWLSGVADSNQRKGKPN